MITTSDVNETYADDVETGVFQGIDDKATGCRDVKSRKTTNQHNERPPLFGLHDDAHVDNLDRLFWNHSSSSGGGGGVRLCRPSPASDDRPVKGSSLSLGSDESGVGSAIPQAVPQLRDIVLRKMQHPTMARSASQRFEWAEVLDSSTASPTKQDEYFQAAAEEVDYLPTSRQHEHSALG